MHFSSMPLSPTSHSLKLSVNFHPRQSVPTPHKPVGKRTYLLLATLSTNPTEHTPSLQSHVDPNPSMNTSVMVVESPKAGVEKSAAAFWRNLLGIQYFSGTSGSDNLSKESLKSPSTTPFITGISHITFGGRKSEKSRQKEGKRGKDKNLMSFARKTNQHQRRAENKCQAGIPHPLRTVPPLPFDKTTYSAHCTSWPGRHDCCITCKSEIVGVYIETCYFYILNKHRLPIELWESTNNHDLNTTTYKLQWRRPDINFIAQYNCPNYHPTTNSDESISYEPHPLIGREQKPIIQSVIRNSAHSPSHKSQQTNLEH